MATFLYKLGRLSYRRRWWVLLVWIALLFGVGTAASTAGDPPPDEFALPGTESQQALDVMQESFPEANAEALETTIVFQAPEGELLTDPENQQAVNEVLAGLREDPDVLRVSDPFADGNSGVNEDGTTAYAFAGYDVLWGNVTEEMSDRFNEIVEEVRSDSGLTIESSGEIAEPEMEPAGAELLGIVVAAFVLIITFGSLVAAGLPLLTAVIGVMIGIMGITALSSTLDLSASTGMLGMMIGLAVGIDYALFIVSRYRAELIAHADRIPDPRKLREEAIGRAVGTAGSAVVFAGLTVIIALSGLAIVNVPILTRMGIAAGAMVAIAVLVALTLVPAAAGLTGKLVFGRRARKQNPETNVPSRLPTTFSKSTGDNMGTRWAKGVLRRPVVALIVSLVGLGALAAPVADMELGIPDNGMAAEDTTRRQAFDMLSEGFGPGFNGQLMFVVEGGDGADMDAATQTLSDQLNGLDGIVFAAPAAPENFNDDGTVAQMFAFPATGPADQATAELVEHIRDEIVPIVEQETGAEVLVAGMAASNIDFSQVMNDALVPYLAIVVGLAFILLVIVFRSLLVPLKAALGFLFSVLAALGVVVAVFQNGWGASLIGVEETGPIMSMMPIFMVGMIFGLAMDYEVFLVTRMREAHVHGEGAKQSVVTGFNLNARVVTAAALIMISVFAAFAAVSADSMIKMMGLGLGAAVLLDAFVVRMIVVPAVMGLVGERAWALPRWLDRILPNVDVEGESLERYLKEQDKGQGGGSVKREREPEPVG
ncbi:MMPL family transporter [Streptomyces sp. 4N509B]|uniref:MMPL family transporter n=1 Tax=Streptomyces sp. 4N509B TaxID=3457413 RepID=UPI003FD56978